MTGVVTAVSAGRVEVELEPPARCAGCNGACFWYRSPAPRRSTFRSDANLAVGSVVTVALSDRLVLLAAALLYGMPWAALLIGALAGAAWFGTDLAAAAGAATAGAAAILVAKLLRRRLERRAEQQLHVRPVGP